MRGLGHADLDPGHAADVARGRRAGPGMTGDAAAEWPRLALMGILMPATDAHADGFDLPAVGARALARAGAGVLATDDGTALLYDPAALARRTTLRAQIGFALHDRTADFSSSAPFSPGLTVHDRAPASFVPWGGVEIGLSSDLAIGAAILTPGEMSLAYPTAPSTLATDDRASYPQRYAGDQLEARRWGGGIGAAVRALPWLAVGASVLAFDVSLTHARTLWGGTGAGTTAASLDPADDLEFAASAEDHFVPAASFGVVIAPLDVPFEFGASFFWSADAHPSGVPTLSSSRDGMILATAAPGASASIDLPLPMTARAAVRWLGDRAAVEVDGELDVASGTPRRGHSPASVRAAPRWRPSRSARSSAITSRSTLASTTSWSPERSRCSAATPSTRAASQPGAPARPSPISIRIPSPSAWRDGSPAPRSPSASPTPSPPRRR